MFLCSGSLLPWMRSRFGDYATCIAILAHAAVRSWAQQLLQSTMSLCFIQRGEIVVGSVMKVVFSLRSKLSAHV